MADIQASFGVPTEMVSRVFRVCKVHGRLSISEFYSCRRKPKGTKYECKACHKNRVSLKGPRKRALTRITDGVIHCSHHGDQPVAEYNKYKRRSGRISYSCKRCVAEWTRNHRGSARQSQRDSWRKLRLAVLSHYSPTLSCAICEESRFEFLALDHISGGGATHRRSSSGVYTYMLSLKRAGFPDGYRVLCHNCNLKHGCRDFYSHRGPPKKPEAELVQSKSAIRSRNYLKRHRERVRVDRRRKYYELKAEVLGHYGGKCACCGLDDLSVLSIDHVGGWGAQHRRELRAQGKRFNLQLLKTHRYPSGFQVLCMNCNLSRGFYGYCPHTHENSEAT